MHPNPFYKVFCITFKSGELSTTYVSRKNTKKKQQNIQKEKKEKKTKDQRYADASCVIHDAVGAH